MKATTLMCLLALLLAGCAKEPASQAIVDTFCLTAKKRLWSINDSAETIRDAEAWNAAVDRKCSGKRVASR